MFSTCLSSCLRPSSYVKAVVCFCCSFCCVVREEGRRRDIVLVLYVVGSLRVCCCFDFVCLRSRIVELKCCFPVLSLSLKVKMLPREMWKQGRQRQVVVLAILKSYPLDPARAANFLEVDLLKVIKNKSMGLE